MILFFTKNGTLNKSTGNVYNQPVESWYQGSQNAYKVYVYVEELNLQEYVATIDWKRADGKSLNNVVMSTTQIQIDQSGEMKGAFVCKVPNFATIENGELTFSISIHRFDEDGNEVIFAQSLQNKKIEKTNAPTDDITLEISEEQYQALLEVLTSKVNADGGNLYNGTIDTCQIIDSTIGGCDLTNCTTTSTPTTDNHLVNRGYVDSGLNGKVSNSYGYLLSPTIVSGTLSGNTTINHVDILEGTLTQVTENGESLINLDCLRMEIASHNKSDTSHLDIRGKVSSLEEKDVSLQEQIDGLNASQNLVDIVATKSELNGYDTSNLEENDKIEVLADETHDGATTIYRLGSDKTTWSYVGKTGSDSYTKSESDATFETKANAKKQYEQFSQSLTFFVDQQETMINDMASEVEKWAEQFDSEQTQMVQCLNEIRVVCEERIK